MAELTKGKTLNTQDALLSVTRGPSCVHRPPVNNYEASWISPISAGKNVSQEKGISVLSTNQRVKENKPHGLVYRSITWAGLYTNEPFSYTERFR